MTDTTRYCTDCDQTSDTYENLVINIRENAKYLVYYCAVCDQEIDREPHRPLQ